MINSVQLARRLPRCWNFFIINDIFFSVKRQICHISWPSPKDGPKSVCQIGENGLNP